MDNPYAPKCAKIISVRQETKTEKTFAISCEVDNGACCGQFYELSLPGVGEAPFSISYLGCGFFETTIRKIGRVSESIHALKPGDEIYLRGPYGSGFPVEKFAEKELVVIAGGTGTAPVRALIRQVEEGCLKIQKLKILLGFRDRENILFEDDIKRWQDIFFCKVTLDYPCDGWMGLKGFVNQHIDKLKVKPDGCAVVVGPPVMIKFVADELMEEGLSASHIWVSLERMMHCGIGKCGHCRIESKYVCVDGPVFDYTSVQDLTD